jgi:hypothetical protein
VAAFMKLPFEWLAPTALMKPMPESHRVEAGESAMDLPPFGISTSCSSNEVFMLLLREKGARYSECQTRVRSAFGRIFRGAGLHRFFMQRGDDSLGDQQIVGIRKVETPPEIAFS